MPDAELWIITSFEQFIWWQQTKKCKRFKRKRWWNKLHFLNLCVWVYEIVRHLNAAAVVSQFINWRFFPHISFFFEEKNMKLVSISNAAVVCVANQTCTERFSYYVIRIRVCIDRAIEQCNRCINASVFIPQYAAFRFNFCFFSFFSLLVRHSGFRVESLPLFTIIIFSCRGAWLFVSRSHFGHRKKI